jgi:hypothetical protein
MGARNPERSCAAANQAEETALGCSPECEIDRNSESQGEAENQKPGEADAEDPDRPGDSGKSPKEQSGQGKAHSEQHPRINIPKDRGH